jgi:hypothetical protein
MATATLAQDVRELKRNVREPKRNVRELKRNVRELNVCEPKRNVRELSIGAVDLLARWTVRQEQGAVGRSVFGARRPRSSGGPWLPRLPRVTDRGAEDWQV